MATIPSLQQVIDKAGSPMRVLWKHATPPSWKPPVVEDEYAGWREEQRAWRDRVALSDQSHHMRDLFIQGPDGKRLLSEISANNYDSLELGQAKQFVPVTPNGHIIQDGILFHDREGAFTLTGPSASQNWVLFHAERGDYDVEFVDDLDSRFRPGGGDPVLFRFQVQGPHALALVEKVFGGPLPATKFFHSTEVTLDGRTFRALRHVMGAQPGYEFYGDWVDGAYVKEAFMSAGEEFGIVHIGALAYAINNLEGGWIPTPVAGIYTDPALRDYRDWLTAFSFEANNPLYGTWFSEDVEDYYVTPFELGYGRSVSFNHEFIGRDALERRERDVSRTKVTIVPNRDDARGVLPEGYFLSHGRYRLEADGTSVGMTYHTGPLEPLGEILSLAIVDHEHAAPGTELTLVYGEHPGPGNDPDGDYGYARLRATVHPAPYTEFARTEYRSDS